MYIRLLRSQLTSLEDELKQLVSYSKELEKKYETIRSEKDSDRYPLNDVAQVVSWNDGLNERLDKLQSKITLFHEDAESMQNKISTFIDQKIKLHQERYGILVILIQSRNRYNSKKSRVLANNSIW